MKVHDAVRAAPGPALRVGGASSPPPIPAPLESPNIRVRHLLTLYFLVFIIAGTYVGLHARHWDPLWGAQLFQLLVHALIASFTVVLSLIVPQMRRSLPILYATPREPLAPTDAFLFMGLMLTWALGAAQMLFVYPMLLWKPDLFGALGYQETIAELSPIVILAFTATGSLLAPFSEELLFRGYFLNLLRRRFGLWSAILLASILFGAGHRWGAPFATVAGVFFSLLYLRYASLVPGTLLHGLHNLLVGPLVLGPYFLVKSSARIGELSEWIPQLVATAAFVPLCWIFWRRFRPAPQ